jgi:molybdopterin-binding protein
VTGVPAPPARSSPATARSARAAGAASRDLSLAEHTCLALVGQGVAHGWAVGTMLTPEGEIGRVWSLSRPLTYRAIDALVERRLLSRKGASPGHGRERTLLVTTAAGRRATARWLDEPVAHLRDIRTELLVKLELRRRTGLDLAPLLDAQRERSAEQLDALTRSHPGPDLVQLWRAESARAIRRFLDQALHPTPAAAPGRDLRLSARNQLRATVTAVVHGEVMATVKLQLADGQSLTSAITSEAAHDLDLAPGDQVVAIVKSTEVMLAKAT